MSSKRMLGIAVFGVVFIVLFIGIMLLTSYLSRDPGDLQLPDTQTSAPTDSAADNAAQLDLIEVTRDNVQAVIKTLRRPESYTRSLIIESPWDDGGSAVYNVEAAVSGDITSLKKTDGGTQKHIIVTPDKLYIWNDGDSRPLEREYDASVSWLREADEWQMIPTYEDVLELPKNAITDAGRDSYGGEDCIYVAYRTARLGYTAKYYISIAHGLLTGVEEYSGSAPDAPRIYKMTTSSFTTGEPDSSSFMLPNGEDVRGISE